MIFSSLQYLLFLPFVAILYWQTRGLARLILVVVASYIFYMSWLPIYGILLFILTTANWMLGLAMGWARDRKPSLFKPLMLLGLLGNLGCLCYYKYANFFLSNLFASINWFAVQVKPASATPLATWSALDILLPLGISFFVFEFVHYLVDVYRGDKPLKSWFEFAAFAAFFPSQIAGPIKRFQDFVEFLRKPLPWSSELFNEGGTLIIQGLFKKVAIADPLGIAIAPAFVQSMSVSSPDAWIASIGFVIQVYCDFSGYTDIGRGSALMFGIRLPENFNLPYLAHDIGEFWRKWHMSLSYWLRDYVYIPLGGSRRNMFLQWRNLFLTMVACGLWHGADWHYVVFGCLQGLGMIVNREWRQALRRAKPLEQAVNTSVGKYAGTALTMLFITVTFTIFRAPDVPTGLNVLASWFSSDASCTLWEPIVKCGVLVFLGIYVSFWLLTEYLKRGKATTAIPYPMVYPGALRFGAWTAAACLMVAARPTVATPFVYFQF